MSADVWMYTHGRFRTGDVYICETTELELISWPGPSWISKSIKATQPMSALAHLIFWIFRA